MPDEADKKWVQRVVALIAIVTVVRLLYLAFACPYALIEDEAHYWEWSRRPGLSYYTKGPGIAWTILTTTALLGKSELAVRFSAPLFGGLLAWCAASLTRRLTSNARAAFTAALLVLLVPAYQALSMLITIDGPYIAMWALALVLSWRGLHERSRGALVALGFVLGVGFLYKYTILLLIPGLLVHAIVSRRQLKLPPSWAVWIGAGVLAFIAAISPVLIWNNQHGWPTVRHLLGHLGVPGGDTVASSESFKWSYDPVWTLEYIGAQIGMVGPIVIVMIGCALSIIRHRVPMSATAGLSRTGALFCLWCSVPLLVFYLFVSLLTRVEGNWPLAAWISMMPPASLWVIDTVTEYRDRVRNWMAIPKASRPRAGFLRRRPETSRQILWHFTVGFGVVAGIAMLRLDLIAKIPVIASAIPVGRMQSAVTLSAHADEIVTEIRARTGQEPFVLARHYGRTSLLAFYMHGPGPYLCMGSQTGGRTTQYDYWDDASLNRPDLIGRPALIIAATGAEPLLGQAFARLEPWEPDSLRGDHKLDRRITIGFDYLGWPGDPAAQ